MNEYNDIDDFFSQYAARVNWALWEGQFDADGIMHSFTEDFVGASPLGVLAGKNDATFKEAILRGWSYYRDLGIHSMNILRKSVTLLDGFHAMAKVNWQCLFVTKKGRSGEIDFEVIYILQMRANTIKIFAYITGDELEAFKEAGLIDESAAEKRTFNTKV